jgi:hypothetical protein
MEKAPHKDIHPQKRSDPLIMAFVAFAGFGFLLLLPAFLFSLGPLISTRGRAWEYDLVRDSFIASGIVFLLFVVSPLVAAYSLSRGHRWSKAPVMAAAISSGLIGILFIMIGIRMGSAGSIIIIAPCLALSVYAFWSLWRKGPV